jgi:phosphatidylinositol alpha-1,6-mannosyltransferase
MCPPLNQEADPGLLFPAAEPIRLHAGPPVLCIIVDAEEEFQWGGPTLAGGHTTSSIRHQIRAHEAFSRYNAKPTYLVTYPVTSDAGAVDVLRGLLADGLCDIGAQLHPWVTPPFEGGNQERLSFPGNLPRDLEREKLVRLCEAIRDKFDLQPTVYKAGRYGFGPSTSGLLQEEGFLVDTSLIPRTRYTDYGGPDFASFDYGPFWFGNCRRMLELPVTRALTGLLATRMPEIYMKSVDPPFSAVRAAGLLARTGLMERITLSPERSDLAAMRRLTRALLRRGERIFTLSYHSPSLEAGHTPYVRSRQDLAVFLDRLSGYLSFFSGELGGIFMTARELHDRLEAGTLSGMDTGPRPPSAMSEAGGSAGLKAQGKRRCLVVANIFPPIHGGSAIVYDSLARFGGGRVSVLAPQEDYRDGSPIKDWQDFDRRAPFNVHRISLLRTRFLTDEAGRLHRAAGVLVDLTIRLSVLRAIRRIVRSEDIAVLCIGELVAGGWLAETCRLLYGLKTLIYVHGEEISTRSQYDEGGRKRRRALAAADGIVAVSRFTRDTLIQSFGVPPEKIELVSNGVDLARFVPRPRSEPLAQRYGLQGRPVLLTVSRLYARKGIDRVIQSLPAVLLHIPDLIYLVVGDGGYRPELEQLVSRHGLGASVVFAGAVPDYELTDHYSLGDVFIMANREMPDGETEGFGLVFLEANACGLPVIAGKAGGSVDAVTDQVNGLVVNGDDVAAIGAAVIALFDDAALRERLRAGGAKVAAASGWERRVDQFLKFCDHLGK